MKRCSATRVRSTENTPRKSLLLTVLVVLALPTAAHAQINSPPPPLMGEPSYHIYSVPFAITSANRPFFLCTNTTDAAIRVGVEGFGPGGGAAFNDPSATSLSVSASGTVLFGSAAVGLSISSNPGIGLVSKGSARILATKRRGIICTAFLADTGNDPPTSMVQLNIVKKLTQKGD